MHSSLVKGNFPSKRHYFIDREVSIFYGPCWDTRSSASSHRNSVRWLVLIVYCWMQYSVFMRALPYRRNVRYCIPTNLRKTSCKMHVQRGFAAQKDVTISFCCHVSLRNCMFLCTNGTKNKHLFYKVIKKLHIRIRTVLPEADSSNKNGTTHLTPAVWPSHRRAFEFKKLFDDEPTASVNNCSYFVSRHQCGRFEHYSSQ